MKAMIDTPPRGSTRTKAEFEAWAKGVGFQTISRIEHGITHYVTSYPGSPKASLARQAGAKIIDFPTFGRMIQERAGEPVQRAAPRPRAPTPIPQTYAPNPPQTPAPPATPAPPSRAANILDVGPRKLFLDDF